MDSVVTVFAFERALGVVRASVASLVSCVYFLWFCMRFLLWFFVDGFSAFVDERMTPHGGDQCGDISTV